MQDDIAGFQVAVCDGGQLQFLVSWVGQENETLDFGSNFGGGRGGGGGQIANFQVPGWMVLAWGWL